MNRGTPTTSGEDWIARNSDRSYPIMEDCSPTLLSGDSLPTNVLADVMLVVALEPSQVLVSSVSIRSTSISVEFSCRGVSIGSAACILGETAEGQAVPVAPVNGACSGWVIFGSIANVDSGTLSRISGVHPMSGVALESRCLVFSGPPPVKSIGAWSGDRVPLSGAVSIDLSSSISSSISESESGDFTLTIGLTDPQSMLPDCVPGVLGGDCGCDGAIKAVNGVSGDETGDLTIIIISPPGAPAGSIWLHPTKNAISILVTTPKQFFCIESPVVPDSFGRLGPDFDTDCPPVRSYGLPYSGPDCTNPPPVIPDPTP